MQTYTTQIDAARKGIVTPQMETVAKKEYRTVEEIRQLVAEGKVAIPANKHHTCLDPEGIGSMLRTKINVNLGVSRDCKDYNIEMQKVMSAVNMGAEAIMDLSSHGNTQPFRQKLTHECPVMIGTVPVYDSVIHYQRDLATLTAQDFIDVVGLHEINNHLGHRSGDAMLCCISNAARKFFASSRIYRIGGDEFVILTPNQPPYSVWVSVDRMRAFLREKEYEISVGIQNTNDLHRLDDAMNQAEAAMRQDKQAYYARNGQERQLRGLNEKLEQTLTEKRDAEHFLRVLAPKYQSVFVVDLKTDRMRGVIVPDYFQKILDASGGSYIAVLQQYRDTLVEPACRESLADLLDYNYIRSKVLTGDIVERTYKKTDGTTFCVKVTPYSKSGTHIDETIWIFSCEDAALTPPPDEISD